ncbi:hypothetical protein BJX76DRAFT_349890 [Aspergillus varians]
MDSTTTMMSIVFSFDSEPGGLSEKVGLTSRGLGLNVDDCRSYYLSLKFADMTVITLGKEFRVYKLVLCSQSGYFASMFNENWLLEGDDNRFVQTMIEFIYGFDYDTTDHGNTSPMAVHITAYQIADKYNVPRMKEHIVGKFEKLVKVCWDLDDFPLAIVEVYQTTPMCDRGLRDPIVQVTSRHFSELLEKEGFAKSDWKLSDPIDIWE